MEYRLLGLAICLLVWAVLAVKRYRRRHRCRVEEIRVLPPGPRRWPVVGNIFQVGCNPHESFSRLAREHGPIMTLWFGSMLTVVISSHQVARDMFKNHDAVLAGRKVYDAVTGSYGTDGSLIVAQYGPNWRTMRRLSTSEFFVPSRLDAMQGIRSRCIDRMVQFLKDAGSSGTVAIEVRKFFFLMSFNLIGNLVFSKDLLDSNSEAEGVEFFYHAEKIIDLLAKPNVSDFFPILRRFDLQGIRRKTHFHIKALVEITGEWIRERVEARANGFGEEKSRDYMDVLLDFRGDGVDEPHSFSSTSINTTILEMFIAGTDTTASTLEWVMTELLRNPRTLQKLQAELRTVIKLNEKLEEKHIENLPYLKAVIKETLRLHPPLPFLVPRRAMDSCDMLGYHVPKETQILVNVWAIGRDAQIWETPLEFRPERFLQPNVVDYKGQHFEFIPFGSGRRMCPAVPLASRLMPMALGSILLAFDWILADKMDPLEMDMSEQMGLTLRKAVLLKAVAIPHND